MRDVAVHLGTNAATEGGNRLATQLDTLALITLLDPAARAKELFSWWQETIAAVTAAGQARAPAGAASAPAPAAAAAAATAAAAADVARAAAAVKDREVEQQAQLFQAMAVCLRDLTEAPRAALLASAEVPKEVMECAELKGALNEYEVLLASGSSKKDERRPTLLVAARQELLRAGQARTVLEKLKALGFDVLNGPGDGACVRTALVAAALGTTAACRAVTELVKDAGHHYIINHVEELASAVEASLLGLAAKTEEKDGSARCLPIIAVEGVDRAATTLEEARAVMGEYGFCWSLAHVQLVARQAKLNVAVYAMCSNPDGPPAPVLSAEYGGDAPWMNLLMLDAPGWSGVGHCAGLRAKNSVAAPVPDFLARVVAGFGYPIPEHMRAAMEQMAPEAAAAAAAHPAAQKLLAAIHAEKLKAWVGTDFSSSPLWGALGLDLARKVTLEGRAADPDGVRQALLLARAAQATAAANKPVTRPPEGVVDNVVRMCYALDIYMQSVRLRPRVTELERVLASLAGGAAAAPEPKDCWVPLPFTSEVRPQRHWPKTTSLERVGPLRLLLAVAARCDAAKAGQKASPAAAAAGGASKIDLAGDGEGFTEGSARSARRRQRKRQQQAQAPQMPPAAAPQPPPPPQPQPPLPPRPQEPQRPSPQQQHRGVRGGSRAPRYCWYGSQRQCQREECAFKHYARDVCQWRRDQCVHAAKGRCRHDLHYGERERQPQGKPKITVNIASDKNVPRNVRVGASSPPPSSSAGHPVRGGASSPPPAAASSSSSSAPSARPSVWANVAQPAPPPGPTQSSAPSPTGMGAMSMSPADLVAVVLAVLAGLQQHGVGGPGQQQQPATAAR